MLQVEMTVGRRALRQESLGVTRRLEWVVWTEHHVPPSAGSRAGSPGMRSVRSYKVLLSEGLNTWFSALLSQSNFYQYFS